MHSHTAWQLIERGIGASASAFKTVVICIIILIQHHIHSTCTLSETK